MNTIDQPIAKTRRTKEEIAKATREKDALKSRLAAYIEANYDSMAGAAINANGFRVIAITIGLPSHAAPAESKAYLGIEYQPEPIRSTDSFQLDDGQDQLFGPAPGAPAGATSPATAPETPAPSTESAPAAPAATGAAKAPGKGAK